MNEFLYGSVCSGIEAASVAFEPLGWTPAWFAEIDPFCSDLLKLRYPGVPNYGDITKHRAFCAANLVIGGTPCQSFSVQGNRGGMADGRGQLSLRFCEILRAVRPRWFIWENVPGALRIEGGGAFHQLISAFRKCGYSLAWRVLDASGFGAPQRRLRLYVVGHFGADWLSAASVLFDPGAGVANGGQTEEIQGVPGRRASASNVCGWTGDETPKFIPGMMPTLRSSQGGEGFGVLYDERGKTEARRLTTREAELAMGFPPGYTDIGASDAVRRRALGNSFCVQVVRWIGRRIKAASA